jgi:hypothetical protein
MPCKRRHGLRIVGSLALLLLVALVAAGCASNKKTKEVKDPYLHATLRAVTRGTVLSKGFLFEIDAPEFVYAHGNTALIRDKNLLEVLVLPDAENRAPTLAGKKLGVQKAFSPFVYLIAKQIRDGTTVTPLDSVPDPVLPKVLNEKELNLEIPGFDLKKLTWDTDSKTLLDRVDSQFQTVARAVQRPDVEPPDSTVAAAQTAPPGEPRLAWFLTSAAASESAFKVANVTPELDWVLHLLQAENLPLIGAMTLTDPLPVKMRQKTKVVGHVQIGWVKYANRYLGT